MLPLSVWISTGSRPIQALTLETSIQLAVCDKNDAKSIIASLMCVWPYKVHLFRIKSTGKYQVPTGFIKNDHLLT